MRKIPLSLATLGTILVPLLSAAPAQAQATRTWVSGVGDDANPCSRTAPCKTFAGAISKTAVHGEINCLDPAGYGAVTITKSITIDCHEIFASILNSLVNGVNILFDNFTAVGESQKTVRLRNLNINGANTGIRGINITGGVGATNTEVFIEDVLIDGNFGSPGHGIQDTRSGGGELSISNTTIRNNGGSGIFVFPASGSTAINVVLDNVRVQNNSSGVVMVNGVRGMINRSVVSGNTTGGIDVETTAGTTQVDVDGTVTSSNGTGILVVGGGTTVRISNSDIAFNASGITSVSGGVIQSFTNNRISGNVAAGTAPTPIGAASVPSGQQ
jgi:Right handed beta helix region